MEVVASLSQGRTAAAQCGLCTHKSVPVISEPPCTTSILSLPSRCTVHQVRAIQNFIAILIRWDHSSSSCRIKKTPDKSVEKLTRHSKRTPKSERDQNVINAITICYYFFSASAMICCSKSSEFRTVSADAETLSVALSIKYCTASASVGRMGQAVHRGELSYLAPLGSENISAPYFKQCFFRGGAITPPH